MASSDWFKGTKLEGSTLGYLKTRKNAKLSSKWRHEKRPWMKLLTNARVAGKAPLAINNPHKTWNVKGMYHEESSGRISARPTVESIVISTTGTAGSMRKAEVKFKVYSYKQLRAAQLAFFIPGMSAIAAWGWTITQSGGAVSTNTKKIETAKSITDAYKEIISWTKKNKGCADAIVGQISDFNWTKSPGKGSDSKAFDCSITIESPTKAYLEQPCDPACGKNCGCPEGSEDEGISREVAGGWVKQCLKDQAESEMGANGMEGELWKNGAGVLLGTSVSFDSDYQGDAEPSA